MIQFDIKRFKSLFGWTLTTERSHYVKTTLTWMVVLTLLFLFYTCVTLNDPNHPMRAYRMCASVVVVITVVLFVIGGALMFQNISSRHDDQRLLMLPASNLEKFIVRYCGWLLMLPCLLAGFVVADLVQWLVNTLLGHDGAMLIMQFMAGSHFSLDMPDGIPHEVKVCMLLTLLWHHSIFVVGATFFRSHKYNWILTSLVLICGGTILSVFLTGHRETIRLSQFSALTLLNLGNWVYLVAIVFNFWLSYRLFCRTQLVGRYINI